MSDVVELFGKLLSERAQLVDGLISEHVKRFPIDGAVLNEEDGVGSGVEVSKPPVRSTGNGTVDDPSGEREVARVDGITATAGGEVTVLEVVRSRKPVR